MGYSIIHIEGIGDVYTKKLKAVGIRSTNKLLAHCRTPKGRENLAELAGISPKLVLEWANLADLMRINGIGEEWADLLEEAGVDTVNELKNRNAENLYGKIIEVNESKKLVRRIPPLSYIKNWIKQAGKLTPALEY